MKIRSFCFAILLPFFAARAMAQTSPTFALSFNGANQCVSAGVPAMASNYTISAWVYLRTGGTDGGRIGVLSASNCGVSIEFLIHSTNAVSTDPQYLELGRCNAFNGELSSQAVPLTQWAHVAVTVSTNQQVRYFINGADAGSWEATNRNLALGPNITLADNTVRKFDGLLDEVQLWGVARDPADIQAGMHRRPDVTDSNLVAYWPFDEGAGTGTTADATGQGHTGTLVNGPAWVSSPVGWTPELRLRGANPLTNECHVAFQEPGTVVGIAGGWYHNLGLRADSTVVAWGSASSGQINVPASATNVVALAAGAYHSLALKADGTVVAWGGNSDGQINVPASATNIVAIAAGANHSLALKSDGTVVGWGYNVSGQANGGAAGSNVVALAAGYNHSLARKADGSVVAWGGNFYGQINVPASATNVIAIAAGPHHCLAVKADGTVVGWGNNTAGQADGAAAGTNVVAIAAGMQHSLALKADGTIVAWGDNSIGQTNVPASATNVIAIAAGVQHCLALKPGGTVLGWGLDGNGQASVPAIVNNPSYLDLPIAVSGAVDVNTPGTYTLAYSATNSVGAVCATTRTVVVVDTLAPVVTLLGSNPLVLAVGTPFIEPGATADDTCYGDLTGSITITGTVNSDVVGSYARTYSVTDAAGNTGAASRAVWVTTLPAINGLSSSCLATNPGAGTREAQLQANVNPNGWVTTAFFEYGLSPAYSGHAQMTLTAGFADSNLINSMSGLVPGYTYHWRIVASNSLGEVVSPDQVIEVPVVFARGDFNGNGVVEDFELDWVYEGYWQDNPAVISHMPGLGHTQVDLDVENMSGWDLSVQASTDLVTWTNLPVRAIPVFQFSDPDATNYPTRVYRLLAP